MRKRTRSGQLQEPAPDPEREDPENGIARAEGQRTPEAGATDPPPQPTEEVDPPLNAEVAEAVDEAIEAIVVDLARNANTEEEVAEIRETVEGVVKRALRITMRASYEGPLPPPWMLERYARLYPEAPRIIFQAFEQQGIHRRTMEDFAIRQEAKRSNNGLIAGFIMFLVIVVMCVYLIFNGYPIVGTMILIATLATLLAAYVFGSQQRNEERRDRVKAMVRALTGRTDRPDQV